MWSIKISPLGLISPILSASGQTTPSALPLLAVNKCAGGGCFTSLWLGLEMDSVKSSVILLWLFSIQLFCSVVLQCCTTALTPFYFDCSPSAQYVARWRGKSMSAHLWCSINKYFKVPKCKQNNLGSPEYFFGLKWVMILIKSLELILKM